MFGTILLFFSLYFGIFFTADVKGLLKAKAKELEAKAKELEQKAQQLFLYNERIELENKDFSNELEAKEES